MPTNDQAQADKLDTATADGNASATEAQATASDNQPATTAYTAPATEGVAAMDDYMKRLQEALEPAPDGDAANDGDQVGDNPPATEGDDAPPNDADQDTLPATDETPPSPIESEEDSVKRRQRVTTHDDTNAFALQIYRQAVNNGTPINFDTAFARAKNALGISDAPVDSEKQTEAVNPTLTPEEIESKIEQLRAERKEAAANIDTVKQNELTEEIESLRDQLKDAREAVITGEQQFQQQVSESYAKTDSIYPAATDPKHPIHTEVERIWSVMQSQKNPLVSDADAPFKIYQMAANALGIAPSSSSSKSSPAPTPRPQAVQQSAAVRRTNQQLPVASGGDRTITPTTALSLPNGLPRSTFEYEQMIHSLNRQ
jgi:hypothetical protein